LAIRSLKEASPRTSSNPRKKRRSPCANTRLAEEAGLECKDGIIVDEFARTSDPDIVAAGDCTSHPSSYADRRLRLESVQNATDQGFCQRSCRAVGGLQISWQKALANFRELSEMEAQSRNNAWRVAQQRLHENLGSLQKLLQPK